MIGRFSCRPSRTSHQTSWLPHTTPMHRSLSRTQNSPAGRDCVMDPLTFGMGECIASRQRLELLISSFRGTSQWQWQSFLDRQVITANSAETARRSGYLIEISGPYVRHHFYKVDCLVVSIFTITTFHAMNVKYAGLINVKARSTAQHLYAERDH